jgi:hypothetical protein
MSLSACKPKPFSSEDIENSKVVLQQVLQAFVSNDVTTIKENFVPTATQLTMTVSDLKTVWDTTLHSVGVQSATIEGYKINDFDVVKNEPDRLTASVSYTGTYEFTSNVMSKTEVCRHQVEVVFVKYQGKILVGQLQQQGALPSCVEVK